MRFDEKFEVYVHLCLKDLGKGWGFGTIYGAGPVFYIHSHLNLVTCRTHFIGEEAVKVK